VLTLANYILAAATAFIGVAIEIDVLFGLFISLYISIRLGGAKTDPFQPTSEGKPYLMILG
jgi:hypothetical protein